MLKVAGLHLFFIKKISKHYMRLNFGQRMNAAFVLFDYHSKQFQQPAFFLGHGFAGDDH